VSGPARLRAEDAQDLAVIAALLQDAQIPVREMVFRPQERRFLAAFARYRRELLTDPSRCEGITQIRSALVFEEIETVKVKGLAGIEDERELSLLTIALEPGRERLIHVDLVFAGDVVVQLRTDAIRCRLEDFGPPWTPWVTPCDHFSGAAAPAKGDPGTGEHGGGS
jgi:hypothetical protein